MNDFWAGLGISIFEYRYTEILKLFSVIFLNIEILKFKPSQFQYYIDILKFKPSQFQYYIDILKFKPSQFHYYIDILKFKPSQFHYYIDILKFKPSQFQYYIDILKFKPSQFRFCRNWQRFKQSLAKRSHAHTRTNKLMYSYSVTLNEYALHLTAYSVLRIDFALICQWLFSRLFPHRSDTLQSMRCTGGKHLTSHWHIIAKSIRNTRAVQCILV